jgi:hypothetical protein
MPLSITADTAKDCALCMAKATPSGRVDDVIDHATSNLWR